MDGIVAEYGGFHGKGSQRRNISSDTKLGNLLECGILISLKCLPLTDSGRQFYPFSLLEEGFRPRKLVEQLLIDTKTSGKGSTQLDGYRDNK